MKFRHTHGDLFFLSNPFGCTPGAMDLRYKDEEENKGKVGPSQRRKGDYIKRHTRRWPHWRPPNVVSLGLSRGSGGGGENRPYQTESIRRSDVHAREKLPSKWWVLLSRWFCIEKMVNGRTVCEWEDEIKEGDEGCFDYATTLH